MKRLPLFDKKNSKKIAENRCFEISNSLTSYSSEDNNIGFMNGLAGISCFFFHFSRYTGIKKYRDLGYSALEKVISAIENGFSDPSFSVGLAGISWVFRYLGYMGFISREESSAIDGLYPLFINFAGKEFENGNFDFLHGALGMWMTVDPFPGERDLSGRAAERKLIGDTILNGISGSVIKDKNGSAYWLSHDPEKNDAEINMGMAHGLPSIISVLSRIYDCTGQEDIVDDLIEPAVNFILKQANTGMGKGSVLPVSIRKENSIYPSRMAWCYGDPGAGMSILNTGRFVKRIEWVTEAEKIISIASSRKTIEQSRVLDSCLCHGSSGLSMIYYILWHETGNEIYREPAEYWAGISLNYGDVEIKRKSYLFNRGYEIYENRYSLLEGISGVGLSLLSLLEGGLPIWARSLLLV